MSTGATLRSFTCIDAQAEQLTGFDQRYQQLDAGAYEGSFLTVQHLAGDLFIEQTNRTLQQEGAGAPDCVSAVVLVSAPEPGVANGLPYTVDDVLLVGPGGSYDAVVRSGSVPAVFSVSAQVPGMDCFAERLQGSVRRLSSPHLALGLRRIARAVWEQRTEPSASSLPAEAISSLLWDAVCCAPSEGGSIHPLLQLFRRARSTMHQRLPQSMSMDQLARRIGTSRRTMEHAFDHCVGMGPGRFRKLMRLNRARRLLEGGADSVATAAMAVGLCHLGRFSSDYRQLFDELPSQTLRRHRC